MVADEFRRIALDFRDAVEGRHQGHPDFRVHGRIFATLGYPDAGWAMVKLTAPQQARFVGAHPECFQCVKGAWGRRGATNMNLFAATASLARRSLALAHRNVTSAERRGVIRARDERRPAAKQKAS
jgi:hypothetical protein